MNDKVYDEPSDVRSKPGKVVVTGPDSVDVTVTPEAAVKTATRLIDKASEAAGMKATNQDAIRRNLKPPYAD
jgi:hypothetical protein